MVSGTVAECGRHTWGRQGAAATRTVDPLTGGPVSEGCPAAGTSSWQVTEVLPAPPKAVVEVGLPALPHTADTAAVPAALRGTC